jgi:c-di-GMP-binding flagellar brake protein YcgR
MESIASGERRNLFWKKKKEKDAEELFGLSYDLDQRQYFRVTPNPGEPVFFHTQKEHIPVVDLSAGGVAVKNNLNLKVGEQVAGVIKLPGNYPDVPVVAEVRTLLAGKTVVDMEFVRIKESGREALHQFVLARQKEDIEKNKILEAKKRQSQKDKNTIP